ncbi:MAG: molecular chaperone DnaJ, partial [Thiomonas sp.]
MSTQHKVLSKEQKAFNGLVKKIESLRKKLSDWDAVQMQFRTLYNAQFLPLKQQTDALRKQLALALDAAHHAKGMTQTERRKLAALIVDLADALLESADDEQVKQLFNTYSGEDFDAIEAEQREQVTAMFEQAFGVDLGEDAHDISPEELARRIQEQWGGSQQADDQAKAARKPSRREQAQAEKLKAEKKQLGQAMRDVFRKLASALHPDRETDP